MVVDVSQMHQRMVRETSEGDLLSDKSASSSTGSVQLSTDSRAASTDSVTAPTATPGVVKIADIPLPDDRPHTISSAIYQPPMRPAIIQDTFEPPTAVSAVTSGPAGKVADIYSRPSLISKDSRNSVSMAVATPTVPLSSNLVPDDNHSTEASGNEESAQHSGSEPSVLQKRKTVSVTDVYYFE